MKLEAGKRYKARNGDITEPLEYVGYSATYPYYARGVGGSKRGWAANGQWLAGDWNPQDYDPIEEYVEVPESVGVKKIKLEIGRRYVTRDGSLVGPLVDSGEGAPKGFPFKDEELVETWRQDGTWSLNPKKEYRLDIVAEYVGSGWVTPPTIMLESGKMYRTRGGVVAGPLEIQPEDPRVESYLADYIFAAELYGETEYWTKEGYNDRHCDGEPVLGPEDLIEEVQVAESVMTPTPDPEPDLYEDLVDWALSEMAETEETGTEFSEGYRFAIMQMLEDVLGLEVMQRTEYGVRGITEG